MKENDFWGPHSTSQNGWLVELGIDTYDHRFGGTSWETLDDTGLCELPCLLLTLDLNDPRLSSLKIDGLTEMPLCYSINCDAMLRTQRFLIDCDSRRVILVNIATDSPETFDERDRTVTPFSESKVKLRAMDMNDYPIDMASYYAACEKFVGGAAFIRILGPPLWLQNVETNACNCGLETTYVASIGYESIKDPSGFLPDQAFFIGEAALYFFLCKSCLMMTVTSQST